MPYTPWLETRRNFVLNSNLDTTYSNADSGAKRMVDLMVGADAPTTPVVLKVVVDPSHPINLEVGFRDAIVTAGGGNVFSIPLEPGLQTIILEATGWTAPTATAGVSLIMRTGWSGGETLHVEQASVQASDGSYFNGDSQDTDTVRYFWAGPVGNSASIEEMRRFDYPPVPKGSTTVRPQDLLVEYRDRNLVRQGSIPLEDLNLKFQPVFNGVGSWSVTIPAEHRAVSYLRAPGAGIIITNLLTGETLMSGSTSKPSKKATSADPKGMVTIAGLSDDRLLWDALAFPQPSNADPATQTSANDVRTATASTLMRLYVNANIGPGSPVGRRGSSLRNALTLGPDALLGAVTTRRPRFDVLGDLLKGIALEVGLGFRIVQVGSVLQFQVYQPTNRSDSIRLDVHNGTLQETTVETAPPEVTRVVVAGQGQGAERQIFQFDTADSLQGEDDWGFIIEEFKDQRNTNDTNELESSAMERLNEAGFTKVAVKATPSNEDTMIFMTDFFLGDQVAVVIDGQEQTNSIITEAAIVVDNTGLRTGVAIGDVYDFDSASALRQSVEDTQRRLDNLERNVEIGPIGWDDIQGKPTTYPPSAHNHDDRYFTETEANARFAYKAHTHAWADLTDPLVNMGGDIDASAIPSSYALGVTVHTAGAGWPASIGTVMNVRHSGYRQFQIFTDRTAPGRMWYRTANGDAAWQPFVEQSTVGHTHLWADITDKPTSFTPSAHTHSAADLTSGTIPEARLPNRLRADAVDLGSADLDDIRESGWRMQDSSADATLARHYPITRAGFLETVWSTLGSDFGLQRYTDYHTSQGFGSFTRTYYNGTWSAWSGPDALPPLPDPVSPTRSADVNSITNTTSFAQGVGGVTTDIVVPSGRQLWVQINFGAWLTATAGETRAGVLLSGATVLDPQDGQNGQTTWGQTLYASASDGTGTFQNSMSKVVKLNAGTTAITLRAYQSGGGTHQVNYPVMEVIPLRWA